VKPKKKHGRHILAFLKGTTKMGVETFLGTDRLKAEAGSQHAKNRLGILSNASTHVPSGPIDFSARYHGKKGKLYISTQATTPCVAFTTTDKEMAPVWSVAIKDIRELKKVGGLGWKGKLVVAWSTGKEIADGLDIVDKEGNHHTVTAIQLREELFNRLVACGGQIWESW